VLDVSIGSSPLALDALRAAGLEHYGRPIPSTPAAPQAPKHMFVLFNGLKVAGFPKASNPVADEENGKTTFHLGPFT